MRRGGLRVDEQRHGQMDAPGAGERGNGEIWGFMTFESFMLHGHVLKDGLCLIGIA